MYWFIALSLVSHVAVSQRFYHPQYTSHWEVGQIVNTTSGAFRGHASTWVGNEEVSEYLGIPYATPPLDQLRFAPPQAFQPSTTWVRDAANYSNDCIQYLGGINSSVLANPLVIAYGEAMGGGLPGQPHNYSEDCLGVNVWTKPQTGEKRKAVMAWIYGGGWHSSQSAAFHADT